MKIYTTEQIIKAAEAGEVNEHDTKQICKKLEEMYPNGTVTPAMFLAGKLAIAATDVITATLSNLGMKLDQLETALDEYNNEIMKNAK